MTDSIGGERPALQPTSIAGFWRRLGAFLIDVLLLSAIAHAFAYVYYDQAVALGQLGRAFGFAEWLIYFTLLDSSLTKGQTLGKAITGVRVVSRDGEAISVGRALLRAAISGLPFFLNGVFISVQDLPPDQTAQTIIGMALIFIVFGVGVALVYLFIFNARTRQSLHDLATNTFVVRASAERSGITAHTWVVHYLVVLLLFAAVIAAPLVLQQYAMSAMGGDYAAMADIQEAVLAEPGVRSAGVNKSTLVTTNQMVTSLIVVAEFNKKPADLQQETVAIAARVLKTRPDMLGAANLSIQVRYGYDLGLAASWSGFADNQPLEVWTARISASQQPPHR